VARIDANEVDGGALASPPFGELAPARLQRKAYSLSMTEVLQSPPPQLALSEAESIARGHFGVDAQATPLSSERDANFRMTLPGGRGELLLKVSNAAEDPAITGLQTAILRHLELRCPSLPLPRLQSSREGADEVAVMLADGRRHVVRMMTFLPGRALAGRLSAALPLRRQIAQLLADLDAGLLDLSPAVAPQLLWDVSKAGQVRPLLIHIADRARRALAERFLDAWEQHAAARLQSLRTQLIHNDFNLHNLLAGDTGGISGIIDFGDAVRAPLICDLATAIAYQPTDSNGVAAMLLEMAAAYHERLALLPEEIEILFDLVAARWVLAVAITHWRSEQYPANRDYILRNTPRAWHGLETIADLERDEIVAGLRRVCFGRRSSMSARDSSGMVNAFTADRAAALDPATRSMIERRARVLGPAYRLFYEEPIHIVRGEGVWLYDAAGERYLDVYNNVASVGHCHPRVVAAIARQSALLNTHTRYLHENVLEYAERLLATFPPELGHVMFTCTGSEANDLALRIARAFTGGTGVIVTELAYHGVTDAIAQLSPSLGDYVKRGPHVWTVPAPDAYRIEGDVGAAFATGVRAALADMQSKGVRVAAMFCDTIFSSDGVLPEPAGFLREAVDAVHAAGGLFVADEVQPGFGRTGASMWGFQRHGVAPDLVTIGKPMGNGHPVAAAVMRPEVIYEFGRKARYFNTFGGNPVSCAAAMATLQVVQDERLMDNAREVGTYLRDGLRRLAQRHPAIGDVRGAGLFIGLELVQDRGTKEADAELAAHIVNSLRRRRILISATGPRANVLKIRPPLVFAREHADVVLAGIDEVLDLRRG
jgi:4-aminobutyrate aminotransferase-like enzyme/Ser/Thr protein kinase RdoA (MazF antagonist)